jgi:hypothetical protein
VRAAVVLVLEVAVLVPEAAALVRAAVVLVLEVAVLVLVALEPEVAVQAPEAAVQAPEVVVQAPELEAAVRAPEVVAQAVEEPAQAEPVVALPAAQVAQPRARAEPERVAPPAQARPAWVAAQVEQLGPASAVAQRAPVSVEAPLEVAPLAPSGRVRSVPLPVLPASALPPAVARPVRGMAPPRGRLARTEVLGGGRGAASWRPLLSRRSPAPTSCVPCISTAINSRAPRNVLRRRTARNCRSTFAADGGFITRRQRTGD